MSNLTCSAVNCVHNMSGLCSANTIHVKGSDADTSIATDCGTFAQKGIKNAITNLGNMNIVGEIKQLVNRDEIEMSPRIKCEAEKCVYNSREICTASNVQIHGPGALNSDGTQCETFVEHYD